MSTVLIPTWRRVQLLLQADAKPLALLVAVVVGFDTLLLAGRPEAWLDLIGAALVILTAGASVIVTSGLVARDFETGMALLWFQKPVDPRRYYLARFGDGFLAVGIVITLTVLAARIVVLVMDWPAETEILLSLPRFLLTGLLISSITFALSPWGSRIAGVGGLLLFFAGMIVERDLTASPELLGGTWTPLVRAVLFPESALAQVSDFVAGDSNHLFAPLLRIFGYCAVWIGFGLLGVGRIVRQMPTTSENRG